MGMSLDETTACPCGDSVMTMYGPMWCEGECGYEAAVEWREVVGHPGYEVSDDGRVKRLARVTNTVDGREFRYSERMMTGSPGSASPHYLKIYFPGRQSKALHIMLLEAFVGPRPDGYQACHRNDVATDNRLTNLYWGTPSENTLDLVRNGRHHSTKKTHCPAGHEYTPENIKRDSRGARSCRICVRASNQRGRERARNAETARQSED